MDTTTEISTQTETTSAPASTVAKRVRKPLTDEQRAAKNARDRARRAAKKVKPGKSVASKPAKKAKKVKKVAKKGKVAPRAKSRSVVGEDTYIAAMVRFISRPQGATHAEICKKFGWTGHDERGRFWHALNTHGFPIKKNKLPKDSNREGRKVFTLAKGALTNLKTA